MQTDQAQSWGAEPQATPTSAAVSHVEMAKGSLNSSNITPREELLHSGTGTQTGFPKAATIRSGHALFNTQGELEMSHCRCLAMALGHSWWLRCFRGLRGSEEAVGTLSAVCHPRAGDSTSTRTGRDLPEPLQF